MNHKILNILNKVLLSAVLIFSLSACHSSKSGSKGKRNAQIETVHTGKATRSQQKIVKEAMTWLGTPYQYGASEKGSGSDCSGMVGKVYEKTTGIKLPRNSAKQAEFCKELKGKDVKVGDLVFFATGKDPNKISHVGIMINDKEFIHASTKKGVVVSDITTPYYQRTFIMFGRPEGK